MVRLTNRPQEFLLILLHRISVAWRQAFNRSTVFYRRQKQKWEVEHYAPI